MVAGVVRRIPLLPGGNITKTAIRPHKESIVDCEWFVGVATVYTAIINELNVGHVGIVRNKVKIKPGITSQEFIYKRAIGLSNFHK
jgi:hypothetical protein